MFLSDLKRGDRFVVLGHSPKSVYVYVKKLDSVRHIVKLLESGYMFESKGNVEVYLEQKTIKNYL